MGRHLNFFSLSLSLSLSPSLILSLSLTHILNNLTTF
jgi:hypothetical protein